MGIFNRRKIEQPVVEERKLNFGLGFGQSNGYARNMAMKLSAFYCGINQISNAIALLPINVVEEKDGKRQIVKHNLTDILNKYPNIRYNHYNMFKMFVEAIILRGAAYAIIRRDENLNVKELQYINPDNVTPLPQPNGTMKYLVNGEDKAIDGINMLHFFLHVDCNMRGISLLQYAMNTIEGCTEAEKHSKNFFKSGANLSGIIKALGNGLDNDKKKQIKDAWNAAFNSNLNDSPVPVAILPNNLEYQPLSVNPQDAQLLQSREFNVEEIARWLSIPVSKLMAMGNESYNSLEFAQLNFLQDTIYPYLKMMAEEMNRKLFRPSEIDKYHIDFDFDVLLETDKKSLASYYKELIVNGIMSINEVRAKLNLEPTEYGDKHIMQLSYTTLENIANGALIQNQNQGQKVDNQVKQ